MGGIWSWTRTLLRQNVRNDCGFVNLTWSATSGPRSQIGGVVPDQQLCCSDSLGGGTRLASVAFTLSEHALCLCHLSMRNGVLSAPSRHRVAICGPQGSGTHMKELLLDEGRACVTCGSVSLSGQRWRAFLGPWRSHHVEFTAPLTFLGG